MTNTDATYSPRAKHGIAWHEEAIKLRKAGISINRIAMKLGKGQATVRFAVNENGERARHAARVRKSRARAGC